MTLCPRCASGDSLALSVVAIVSLWALGSGCGNARPAEPQRMSGVWHEVAAGDTIDGIARRYGAEPAEVAELNDLVDDRTLVSRQEIFVPVPGKGLPGASGAAVPLQKEGGAAPTSSPAASKAPSASSTSSGGATAGRCSRGERPCLIWPAEGPVASGFGDRAGRPHDGIDITAPRGAPIRAAAAGEVIYSGDKLKGYGNLVIVRHERGLITVYAHNEANLVKEGERVEAGTVVGRVGQSGNATSPHLHFEVRLDEQPVDPLDYLPRKEAP